MKIALFGSNGETRNRGVSALATATVSGILHRVPHAEVTWFDDGWGVRPDPTFPGVTRCGARLTRRYHRPESYQHMRVCAALGGFGNPGANRLQHADAVLDTSGGDSFTDMYGPARWRLVNWPKRLAVACRRPLFLLPQTYGPFRHPQTRREARRFVLSAAGAWARDAESFGQLADLLGADCDPTRHRRGVDMAFALEPHPFSSPLDMWFEQERAPVALLNLSGLLLDPAGKRFGLRADLGRVITVLADRLLADGARLLLVPHVSAPGTPDDDEAVTAALAARLRAVYGPEQVAVAPPGLNCQETKWLISRGDWLCAMRMHAAIAALSSGVPAAGIAYSDKTRGVFATVGQDRRVADARTVDTDAVLAALWSAWTAREQSRRELRTAAPVTVAAAHSQLDDLVGLIATTDQPPTTIL